MTDSIARTPIGVSDLAGTYLNFPQNTLRLNNLASLVAKSSEGSDIRLVQVDGSNQATFGSSSAPYVVLEGGTEVQLKAAGALRFAATSSGLTGRTATGRIDVLDSSSGWNLYLLDVGTTPTATNYALRYDSGGTSLNDSLSVELSIAGVSQLGVSATEVTLNQSVLRWAAGAAPSLGQTSTAGSIAQALTVQAQSSTHLTGVGGDLLLCGGEGTTPGAVQVKVGGVAVASWQASGQALLAGVLWPAGTPAASTVPVSNGAGSVTWVVPAAGVELTTSAPADVTKSAGTAGVGTKAAREDHKHDISTAAPSAIGTTNSEGTATSLSRSDHVHQLPFSAVQSALGAATGAVGVNGQRLTAVGDPSVATDAATKNYVDTVAQGLTPKGACLTVATGNVATLSGLAQTVDNVALDTDGYRVLLTAQGTATQNGIWVVHAGAWTRPTDFATGTHAASSYTFITKGTSYADSGWVCTTDGPSDVVDTNTLAWAQFSGAGQITAGSGLTKSGNTLNVGSNADGSITVNADDIQVGVLATDTQHGTRGGGTLHAAATTSTAGFMSSSDKTKLDGVAASATNTPLSSTTPSTVDATAGAVGVGTTAARSDHTHAVNAGTPTGLTVGGSNTAGTAVTLARSDHVHALPAFGSSAGTFCEGSDSRVVNAVQATRTISTTSPLAGGGTLSADLTLSVNGATTSALGVVQLTGDIAGSATSVTVTKVNGASVPVAGSLTTGHVLKVSGVSALSYGFIDNASIATAAAIVVTKLATGGANQVLWSNGTTNSWTGTPQVTSLVATDYVTVGASSVATSGSFRVAHPLYPLTARNIALNGDIFLISLDASSDSVTFGDYRVATNYFAADTSAVIRIVGTNRVTVTATTATFGFGTSVVVGSGYVAIGGTPAASGAVRLASALGVSYRNAANTYDYSLIATDASDNIWAGHPNVTNYNPKFGIFAGGAKRIEWDGTTQYNTFSTEQWAALYAPIIKSEDDSTASITGKVFTLQAQNATGATSIGGELRLKSGTGTTNAGDLTGYTGGTQRVIVAGASGNYVGFTYRNANNTLKTIIGEYSSGAAVDVWMLADATSASGTNYFLRGTGAANYVNAGTTLSFNVAATTIAFIDSTGLGLNKGIAFQSSVSAPSIGQNAVASGTGQSLSISAQDSGDEVGGKLMLKGGAGVTGNGALELYTGALLRASFMGLSTTGPTAAVRFWPGQRTYMASFEEVSTALNLYMFQDGTTPTSTNYAIRANSSTTILNGAGNVSLAVNGSTVVTFTPAPTFAGNIYFSTTLSNPMITPTSRASGDGTTFTLYGQNTGDASATSRGGDVAIRGGQSLNGGLAYAGNVIVACHTTAKATFTPSALTFGYTTNPITLTAAGIDYYANLLENVGLLTFSAGGTTTATTATTVVDFRTTQQQTVTLQSNTALQFRRGSDRPGVYRMIVKQDAVGGRSVTAMTDYTSGSVYKPSGTIDIATTANSITLVALIWDGANWYCSFAQPMQV